MDDPTVALKTLSQEKEFFIGIDSDGCAFDTMEIKHKECFCPAFINHFDLQSVSKYAREVWEFVNLYSRTRGVNRFLAVIHAMELLSERDEVVLRGLKVQEMKSLRKWVAAEAKLGSPALKKAVDAAHDAELSMLYDWSADVNEAVAKIVRNVSPFPFVRESLDRAQEKADMIVVSQTPVEALNREWHEHGIDGYVKMIAGQEMGTKTEHIRYAAKGKYDDDKILMIGDAPGDLKAAKDNNALYFPIIPGQEEQSWENFYNEGLDRFFNGTFSGEYEQMLIDSFFTSLPEQPPWKTNT